VIAVDRKTTYHAALIAALVALICVIFMGFIIRAPDPNLTLQPSQPGALGDFLKPINDYPHITLRFFAFDSLFVISYLMVFVGLYTVVATSARTFALLGLGAGILTAFFDALENAYFITYALSALNGAPLAQPELPAIYIIANLKWVAAFVTLAAFGLVWPRADRFGWTLSILMLAFPLIGVLGVALPDLVLLRGLTFLLGMPLFALYFRREARLAL
jgi:hypothetical protein